VCFRVSSVVSVFSCFLPANLQRFLLHRGVVAKPLDPVEVRLAAKPGHLALGVAPRPALSAEVGPTAPPFSLISQAFETRVLEGRESMTPASYEEIVEGIQRLTPAQQRRLLQELTVLLRPPNDARFSSLPELSVLLLSKLKPAGKTPDT